MSNRKMNDPISEDGYDIEKDETSIGMAYRLGKTIGAIEALQKQYGGMMLQLDVLLHEAHELKEALKASDLE